LYNPCHALMDWRAGNRRQPTGSAFRGVGTRGRGRGRGLGIHNNNRGFSGVPTAVSQSVAIPEGSNPPRSPIPGYESNAPSEIPVQAEQAYGKGAARVSSPMNHIDGHKTIGSSGTPRQIHAHNPSSTSSDTPISSPNALKTPSSKTSRKRSHNRNRSSTKASSATPSLTVPGSLPPLNEKDHSSGTESHGNVPKHTMTDIDALVERVRAMAMAGSALEKEKGKDKSKFDPHTSNEGHLDWAGDLDDSLPNLDDWVKPKPLQEEDLEPHVSSIHSEAPATVANNEAENHTSNISIETNSPVENTTNVISSTIVKKASAPSVKRTRSRQRKKSKIDAALVYSNTEDSKTSPLHSPLLDGGPDARIVHPLPAKPEDPWKTITAASENLNNTQEMYSPNGNGIFPQHFSFSPAQNNLNVPQNETRNADKEFPRNTANKPECMEHMSTVETVIPAHKHPAMATPALIKDDAGIVPTTTPVIVESGIEDRRKGEWAESVDPLKFLLPGSTSLCVESSHTDYVRSTGRNSFTMARPDQHTRSHRNSPERKFRNVYRDGNHTHHRAHSSPQTGPGTRLHASRPIISGDALSMISRTLAVASAGSSPRKRPVELNVEHSKES